MNNRFLSIVLLFAALLPLTACGSENDQDSADNNAYVLDDEFDVSQLPDDFPPQLILPNHERVDYVDMTHVGGVAGASFESTAPVAETIRHYTELLGEADVSVDAGEGDYVANWHKTPWGPWVVGVFGNDGESIVSVSRLPAD